MLVMQLLARTWALPYTLLGLGLGLAGIATGGKAQVRRGIVEFYGGAVRWILENIPVGSGGASAMTLGHVILGQTTDDLDWARDHEHVHVRQFERWGLLMGPAYFGCMLWLWLTGTGRPYRDNPFEVQAFEEADLRQN